MPGAGREAPQKYPGLEWVIGVMVFCTGLGGPCKVPGNQTSGKRPLDGVA